MNLIQDKVPSFTPFKIEFLTKGDAIDLLRELSNIPTQGHPMINQLYNLVTKGIES